MGRLENAIGWYHSHPGYGCWLSGIDVSTQMLNQQFQEPFVAIVVSQWFSHQIKQEKPREVSRRNWHRYGDMDRQPGGQTDNTALYSICTIHSQLQWSSWHSPGVVMVSLENLEWRFFYCPLHLRIILPINQLKLLQCVWKYDKCKNKFMYFNEYARYVLGCRFDWKVTTLTGIGSLLWCSRQYSYIKL